MSPPKQKRAPAKSAFQSAEQLAGYVTSCVLQARTRMTRHCVACGAYVPNRNFSGYDGKGARIKSATTGVGPPSAIGSGVTKGMRALLPNMNSNERITQ